MRGLPIQLIGVPDYKEVAPYLEKLATYRSKSGTGSRQTVLATPVTPPEPPSNTERLKSLEAQLEKILQAPIESELEFDDSLRLAQAWAQDASRVFKDLSPGTSQLTQGILAPLNAALVRPEVVHPYSGEQLLAALGKARYGLSILAKRLDLYTEAGLALTLPATPSNAIPQQAPAPLSAAKGDSNLEPQDLLFDVAIICALRMPELEKVLKTGAERWTRLPPDVRDPQTYHRGVYTTAAGTRLRVIAAAPNQMGPPAAAALATKMILRFKPRLVAMVGIAAGARVDTRGFGDILSPDVTFDYSSGKLTDDETKVAFTPDPKPVHLNSRLLSLLRDWQASGNGLHDIWRNWDGSKPDRLPRLLIGPLASGSSVVATRAVVDDIGLHWRKLIGLEMEAYAVHCACRDTVSPETPYLAFKAVCDFADGSKADDWQPYAAYTAAQSLHHFLVAEWENLVLPPHPSA
ncbi:hypothetical protein COEX109129_35180 [Corallococcus exiguus]